MIAAHVVAALAVAWYVRRADAACRGVGDRLADVLDAWLVLRWTPPGRLSFMESEARWVPARTPLSPRGVRVLAHAVVRRGPPGGEHLLGA